ncbi:carboxypeptidase-like regulatory domain-containing protein [Taibaiella lutea]|uniref:Carboxypeptidase-like regulatory domain-containing protein n=1 Tax=Taibaiella lutea TaxID=2608001 RepID=A0A5M6CGS0_9BACT|nr:carboxypeptidase-like regulatory domain-containing protein [Taibaiella lutea]KAA5532615.1 carboxypeptidase-like regulatory domain-containing protein [Taibaiella lutea]
MNTGSNYLLRVIIFTLPLFLLCVNTNAQLKGTVTDKGTHQAIAGASVYINNTTYGCKANQNGHFEMVNFPVPPYQIIISSIGYKTATYNVTAQQSDEIKIALEPKIQNLNEVVILSPEKDGWARYGEEFTKDFIGYSAFAKECEILNKEVIEFRDDKANHTLLVTARKPLMIKNKATGYLITYWLEDYEKDYLKHKLFFKGYSQFEALESRKKKANERWESNRESAYRGSIQHFMRSVYHNSVYEDSFEIRLLKRVTAQEYGRYVPIKTDTFNAITDSLILRMVKLYLNYGKNEVPIWSTLITNWSKDPAALMPVTINGTDDDSLVNKKLVIKKNPHQHNEIWIQYFDFNFTPVDSIALKMAASKIKLTNKDGSPVPLPKRTNVLYQVLWREKMPTDSFVTRNANAGVNFKFKDFLQITYLGEQEEPEYIGFQSSKSNKKPDNQESIISIRNQDGIYILPNGNYYDPYNLFMEKYWAYEKIDKLLPLDYKR